jgi:hypothetical protein
VGVLSVVNKREDIMGWLVDFQVLAKNFIHNNILVVRSLPSAMTRAAVPHAFSCSL